MRTISHKGEEYQLEVSKNELQVLLAVLSEVDGGDLTPEEGTWELVLGFSKEEVGAVLNDVRTLLNAD